jgi:hypothetical protein
MYWNIGKRIEQQLLDELNKALEKFKAKEE